MNVIVTGGTSFIGLAVIRKLLESGHEVWAAVRPGSANKDKLPSHERLHTFSCSLEEVGDLPFTQEGKRLAARKDKAFLHMAWDGVGSAGRSDKNIQEQNIRNSIKAAEAAQALGCGRFLFSGSQAEYGVHREVMTEDAPCAPVSEYGKAKLEFGKRAEELCRKSGMEYVHCRIFSVYGPGDHPWSLVNSCIRAFEEGGCMKLGECTQKWNFLYIDDAAEAIAALLTSEKAISGIYNIAGNDTRVLREFIEEIYEICGKKGSFVYGTRGFNAEGPASLIPDISRVEKTAGWEPAVSFREGIERTRRALI